MPTKTAQTQIAPKTIIKTSKIKMRKLRKKKRKAIHNSANRRNKRMSQCLLSSMPQQFKLMVQRPRFLRTSFWMLFCTQTRRTSICRISCTSKVRKWRRLSVLSTTRKLIRGRTRLWTHRSMANHSFDSRSRPSSALAACSI